MFNCEECNNPELPFTCAMEPSAAGGLKFDSNSLVAFTESGNFKQIVSVEGEEFDKTKYYVRKEGSNYSIPCAVKGCSEVLSWDWFKKI